MLENAAIKFIQKDREKKNRRRFELLSQIGFLSKKKKSYCVR